MRSKKRIKPFLKFIKDEWEKSPDLRFGQLLINLGIVDDGLRTWNAEMLNYPLPHEVMREIQTWGKATDTTKGFKRKDILIKDLDTDHIKAILKTQKHIKDTKLELILKDELKFRKDNLKRGIKKLETKKIS